MPILTKKMKRETKHKLDTPKQTGQKESSPSDVECEICCESYNRSNHKLLKCPFCQFNACTGCIKMFLLSTHQEPHCMKCKTAWSRDFWMDSFPKIFINVTLKKHREDVLLDREKSMLPASQPAAERIREAEKIKQTMSNLLANINKEKHNLWAYSITDGISELDYYNKKKELTINVAIATFEYEFQQSRIYNLENRYTNKTHEQHRQFVRACPADGCKGMLSTQWKCGLCSIFVCPECHEIIGEKKDSPHTCKPENVATAKLLAKDTKTCPKCASLIFRTAGCSQMFCTQCNHAFDWVTMKEIEQSVLHNPHFFQWRATHANAPVNANVPCGGVPSQYALQNKIRLFGGAIDNETKIAICQHFLSSLYHNRDVEMRRFRPNDAIDTNEDLRIKYLLDKISEDKFKHAIFFREKVNAKKTEIYRVMELFDTVSRDISVRLNNANTCTEFLEIWSELPSLIDYVNSQMEKISKRYNHVTPRVSKDTFRWLR